jgi:hypothetical protein
MGMGPVFRCNRSVLEVFAADRARMIQRLYPTREDTLGVGFLVREIGHCSAVWLNQALNLTWQP